MGKRIIETWNNSAHNVDINNTSWVEKVGSNTYLTYKEYEEHKKNKNAILLKIIDLGDSIIEEIEVDNY